MRIQVLVVSEIRFFREGLANSLGGEEALEILDAVSPDAVAATIRHRRPDVVLLHVSIPSGPRLARTIAAVVPRVGMIALAVEEDECSIVAWAEAGVAGYIPPDGSLTQVADAARLVSQGGAACTPHAAAVIVRRISRLAPGPPPRNLTTREVEIAGREV